MYHMYKSKISSVLTDLPLDLEMQLFFTNKKVYLANGQLQTASAVQITLDALILNITYYFTLRNYFQTE